MTDSTNEAVTNEAIGTGITQDALFRLDAQDLHVEVVDGEIVAEESGMPSIHVFIVRMLFKS